VKFEPRNRHILVERIQKEEEESNVLLPEGYKKVDDYVLLKVVTTSPDCSLTARKGEKVIVPNHLVQDIDVENQRFSIVLENHVCGVVYTK
jgi:co-chaperonin GroES (HSP10)